MMIKVTNTVVSILSAFVSCFGRVRLIVSLYRSSGEVCSHLYIAMNPIMNVNSSKENTIGSNLIPQGVKLRIKPMSGTIAMETPKLNAIRSVSSMPFSVFLEGKSAKMVRYPGMKRIIGKLIMIRKISFILRRIRKSPMILQMKHRIIVFGYLTESLRIC